MARSSDHAPRHVAHLESFSKMRERINFFHQYLA
jgi:hypothetical protein